MTMLPLMLTGTIERSNVLGTRKFAIASFIQ